VLQTTLNPAPQLAVAPTVVEAGGGTVEQILLVQTKEGMHGEVSEHVAFKRPPTVTVVVATTQVGGVAVSEQTKFAVVSQLRI